jgi:hypothetical protein
LREDHGCPDALLIHMLSYMTNVMGCILYQQPPSAHTTTRMVITASGDVELTQAMFEECQRQVGAFGYIKVNDETKSMKHCIQNYLYFALHQKYPHGVISVVFRFCILCRNNTMKGLVLMPYVSNWNIS